MNAIRIPKECASRPAGRRTGAVFYSRNTNKTVTYTVFLKFVKDVLGAATQTDDAQLILATNPDLDLI